MSLRLPWAKEAIGPSARMDRTWAKKLFVVSIYAQTRKQRISLIFEFFLITLANSFKLVIDYRLHEFVNSINSLLRRLRLKTIRREIINTDGVSVQSSLPPFGRWGFAESRVL